MSKQRFRGEKKQSLAHTKRLSIMGKHGITRRGLLLNLVSGIALLGCSGYKSVEERPDQSTPGIDRATSRAPWFQNITNKWQLNAVNDIGPTGSFFMPQSMGNGIALLDADADGRLDILLLNSGSPDSDHTNELFLQKSLGHFENVTPDSGVNSKGIACGVAVGDVNNDGLPDIVVTEYGGLKLFVNRGGGRFQDMTSKSGLVSTGWNASAAFFDYDRDGRLDLVIARYVSYSPDYFCYHNDGDRDFCGPQELDKVPASLFHNDTIATDSPHFTDVSEVSGVSALPAAGLGVLCADFNGDSWDDVFIANDQEANHLWINQHNGTFSEEALLRGLATDVAGATAANMGIAWGDIDGDGFEDLFVTHLRSEMHTLWKQGPRGFFADVTAATGIAGNRRATGFGTVFADFDLDGDLDVTWVTGGVRRGASVDEPAVPVFWRPYAELNDLMMNDGQGRFVSIAYANPALCGRPNVARPLCAGDIDNDGDVDLLVGVTDGQPILLENTAPHRGAWLSVRAIDAKANRDAYGATVTVSAKDRHWQRLVQPGFSYFSSSDPRVFFGLGEQFEIDDVLVRWPDGTRERFMGGAANRHIVLRQGEGVLE